MARETHALLNAHAMNLRRDDAEFKMHYWGVDHPHYDNPVHRHSFFEICYVLEGEGEYTDGGIDFPLRRGTHFCSKPGAIHQIRSREGMFLLFVAFELDESRSGEEAIGAFRSLFDKGKICVHDAEEAPSALLWKSLLVRSNGPGRLSPRAVRAAARALLLSFPDLFASEAPLPASSSAGRYADAILRQAKLYIRDNLPQPLRIGEIAGYLNVSERHLSRLFSGGIGENFTNYVRSERIRKAADLLASTDLPIKEIAEASGFSSVHYFTRVFVQDKGMPPGKYRGQYAGAPRK